MLENTSPETALQALQNLVVSAQALRSPLGTLAAGVGGYKPMMVAALHEKGCATAAEILVLLRNGFADGALARWRSLYEIELIASFLAIHEDEVAERYFNHAAIKNWEWALSLQEALKTMPVPAGAAPQMNAASFIASYKQKRDESVRRYGTKFKQEYGWAANVVGTAKKNGPNRGDLEKALGKENMASVYKSASYQVHPMANAVIGFAGVGSEILVLAGMMTAMSLKNLNYAHIAINVPIEQRHGVAIRITEISDKAAAAFNMLP